MKYERILKEKGITLVSLVVTIIILLILAGISIAQLTGSGLFESAKQAEQKSKEAQEKEEGILEDYENKIAGYIDGTRDGIKTQVLWTNPNDSTQSFEAQTITLSSADYDYFDVIYRYYSTEAEFYVKKVYKGYSFSLDAGSGYSNVYTKRTVTYIDDVTLKFNSGFHGSSSAYNLCCIPEKIIGYKL